MADGRDRDELSQLLAELVAVSRDDRVPWARPPARGTVVDGRFEVVRTLGHGGFGVVLEVEDLRLERRVAFKAVRRGARRPTGEEERLLRREAQAIARLSHPNIVTLHDAGWTEDGPYLVLELLEGETLAERLARGAASRSEAIGIAADVARALAHAHGAGVLQAYPVLGYK
jgi:serine/threonine protein kinase